MDQVKDNQTLYGFLEDYPELANTRFKFWVCPAGCRETVVWEGDLATCGKCGTTSKDPVVQDLEDRLNDSQLCFFQNHILGVIPAYGCRMHILMGCASAQEALERGKEIAVLKQQLAEKEAELELLRKPPAS